MVNLQPGLDVKYSYSRRIYCLDSYKFNSLKAIWRSARRRWDSGELGNDRSWNRLNRIGQRQHWLGTQAHRRRWRAHAGAKRAIHALAGDFLHAVGRGDDDLHHASTGTNQLRGLRVDHGGRDGDPQSQGEPNQHETCKEVGAAQGLHVPIIADGENLADIAQKSRQNPDNAA